MSQSDLKRLSNLNEVSGLRTKLPMGNFYLQGKTCLRIMPIEKEEQGNGGILSTWHQVDLHRSSLGFCSQANMVGIADSRKWEAGKTSLTQEGLDYQGHFLFLCIRTQCQAQAVFSLLVGDLLGFKGLRIRIASRVWGNRAEFGLHLLRRTSFPDPYLIWAVVFHI